MVSFQVSSYIKMKTVILIAFIAGSVLLAGCVFSPTTTNPRDSAAKQFQPPPGKASLYLIRDLAGGGTTLQIVLDGRIAGSLPSGQYQCISVDPGEHVLTLNVASDEMEN